MSITKWYICQCHCRDSPRGGGGGGVGVDYVFLANPIFEVERQDSRLVINRDLIEVHKIFVLEHSEKVSLRTLPLAW